MPLNSTENYLRDRQKCAMMNFVDTVATADRYLKGPGNYAGDGYPLVAPGKVLRLYVYDGTNMKTCTVQSEFEAGDRLSVMAEYDSPWFRVIVRINGVDSGTICDQLSANATLRATVLLKMDVY